MEPSRDIRALGWSILAASISLGKTFLLSAQLQELRHSVSGQSDSFTARSIQFAPATHELVEQGHQLFVMNCSECHGDDAHGDEGPDLHALGLSNARIVRRIKNGVHDEMPSFAKKFDDAQLAALVTYLRSLR